MKPFRRRTERHGWGAAGGAWMAGLWIVSAGVSFARRMPDRGSGEAFKRQTIAKEAGFLSERFRDWQKIRPIGPVARFVSRCHQRFFPCFIFVGILFPHGFSQQPAKRSVCYIHIVHIPCASAIKAGNAGQRVFHVMGDNLLKRALLIFPSVSIFERLGRSCHERASFVPIPPLLRACTDNSRPP